MLTWFQIGLLVEQSLDLNGPEFICSEAYDKLMQAYTWNALEYNEGVFAAWECEVTALEYENDSR